MKPEVGSRLAEVTRAVGIEVVGDDGSTLQFKCKTCGLDWNVKWGTAEECVEEAHVGPCAHSAEPPKDWNRCPNGCNKNVAEPARLAWKRFLKGKGEAKP